jgi:hypothetical protein
MGSRLKKRKPYVKHYEFIADYDDRPRVANKHWHSIERTWGNYWFAPLNEAARRELLDRTPEEWAKIVKHIADQYTRNHVACLVWWDYFGHRPAAYRWPHLDKYVNAPFMRVTERDTINGLVQVGYTRDMACYRVKAHDTIDL